MPPARRTERTAAVDLQLFMQAPAVDWPSELQIPFSFSEGGMLSDGSIKAAAASVDNDGRYSMKSIDKALANCSTPLSVHARIEIKNTLMRYSLIK